MLASNDAAPISSSTLEELKKKVLRYISRRKEITYYDLEKYLQKFINVRGQCNLSFTKWKNAITWNETSDEFIAMVVLLQESKKVTFCHSTEEQYAKGRKPKLPVATKREDHEEPQWHPMIIKYIS